MSEQSERLEEAERQAFDKHEAPSWEVDPEARDAAIRWHLRGFLAGAALIEEAVTAEQERIATALDLEEVNRLLYRYDRATGFGVRETHAALLSLIRADREPEPATEATPAHWTLDDRLMDLHARYHDQPGNMLGRDECEWERCEFWDAASFALAPATEEGGSRG